MENDGTRPGIEPPEAICFDLDDTLISCDSVSEPAWAAVCDEAAEEIGSGSAEALRSSLGEIVAWYWKDPERGRRGRMNLPLARRELIGIALERLGIANADLTGRLADQYGRVRDALVHLLPGAVETLERLQRGGIRLCLITNGASSNQRAKIDRFNLARFFDEILIEEEMGFGKPDPRIYAVALDRLETASCCAWMVGDNLEWDIAGAQRSGLFAIWHDWRCAGLPKDAPAAPDRIITAMGQIIQSGLGWT